MFKVEPQGEDVALLRMDDAKVNAIGPRFVEAFPAAWREAARGERAIVIAGNARAFSAGLDLKTLPTLDRDALVDFCRGFVSIFRSVYEHPRPVVAAVGGPALAGGAFLALSADFRLVTANAKLGLTEVPVGIPFPRPLIDLATGALPAHEHAPALLQGNIRVGAQCVASGWAHRLAPAPTLVEDAVALARELAGHNPVAYRLTKDGLRGRVGRDLEAFEKNGPEAWVDTLMAPETMAAIVSYFERVTRKA